MADEFTSPPLTISDYYDKQINQIDIYVEKLLEKYGAEVRLPNEQKPYEKEKRDDENKNDGETYKDTYRVEFVYDNSATTTEGINAVPGETKVRDYINQVRLKAIEVIRAAQNENLDAYELNRTKYTIDRANLTGHRLEELRTQLFANKFAFVLEINQFDGKSNQCLFKLYTVVVDFYLNQTDLDILKQLIQGSFNNQISLDQKNLILHLVKEYIFGILRTQKYGIEVITIKKESLFGVEKVVFDYNNLNNVNLGANPNTYDLSFIKSLAVAVKANANSVNREVQLVDLSALPNLEFLKVERLKTKKNSFDGLNKLIKLDLNECDLYDLDFEASSCFSNLKVLKINKSSSLFSAKA